MTRLALITGASGGLGSAIAAKLAMEGYRLALHYFKNEDKAEAFVAAINSIRDRRVNQEIDLTNIDQQLEDAVAVANIEIKDTELRLDPTDLGD